MSVFQFCSARISDCLTSVTGSSPEPARPLHASCISKQPCLTPSSKKAPTLKQSLKPKLSSLVEQSPDKHSPHHIANIKSAPSINYIPTSLPDPTFFTLPYKPKNKLLLQPPNSLLPISSKIEHRHHQERKIKFNYLEP